MDGLAVLSDDTLENLAEIICAARGEEVPPRLPERHELTDAEWELIAPHLPEPKAGPGKPGRPPRSNRQMLNGMLWLLRTGAPWRDLPRSRFGPWKTVHHRLSKWRREGVIEGLVEGLMGVLNDAGKIDWDLWCIDGSVARAARCAGGARKKGGRQANRPTMHLACPVVEPAPSSTCSPTARGRPSLSR